MDVCTPLPRIWLTMLLMCKFKSMCNFELMPLVPSPEPWGLVWVVRVTNKELKKIKLAQPQVIRVNYYGNPILK